MTSLALAHLMHRKLRTTLSVLAVGVGIAMLIVMLGISHGMLDEVVERMQSVDAELIVLPQNENAIFMAGAPFSAKIVPLINAFEFDGRPAVKKTLGVTVDTIQMGGQQQRLFGVDVNDMPAFLGRRKLVAGRLFDEGRALGNRLDALRNAEGYYDPRAVTDGEIDPACELVIDERLARVGRYKPGDRLTFLGRSFEIVGIVESGVAGRVFCPIQVLQFLKNSGSPWLSLMFVQLNAPPDGTSKGYEERVADALGLRIKAKVEPKSAYRDLMYDSFAQVYLYINVASAVALLVCFLFILLVMYMMVLERTREIGILKSLGATPGYLIREAIAEAVLICVAGTLLGIVFAYGAKFGIETFRPLVTLSIQWNFIGVALLIGVVGGTLSALYPGYRAAKLDPATALNFD